MFVQNFHPILRVGFFIANQQPAALLDHSERLVIQERKDFVRISKHPLDPLPENIRANSFESKT